MRPSRDDFFRHQIGDDDVSGGGRTIADPEEGVVAPVIRRPSFFAGADSKILREAHKGILAAGVCMKHPDLIACAVEEQVWRGRMPRDFRIAGKLRELMQQLATGEDTDFKGSTISPTEYL